MPFDTEWFVELISRSAHPSQRKFAKKVIGRNGKPLEPSALSRMLRGHRSMQLHEARQFADLLNVPLVDVIHHAGITVPDNSGGSSVHVTGYLDGRCQLHPTHTKETVDGPGDLPKGAHAIRCRTARSENAIMDGWVIFTEKPAAPRSDIIGKLCLVYPKGSSPALAFIQRGYRRGTHNLTIGFGTANAVENATLEQAAPVLWIRA